MNPTTAQPNTVLPGMDMVAVNMAKAIRQTESGGNFNATADDAITLKLCEIGGTQLWREISRSAN